MFSLKSIIVVTLMVTATIPGPVPQFPDRTVIVTGTSTAGVFN